MSAPKSSVDPQEIDRFSALAAQWWDGDGAFRALHKFNPLRLDFLRQQICRHFERDQALVQPFSGLRLLDIGCGGGLLCEPMCRLGARVTGADAGEAGIEAARIHGEAQGLEIDYRHASAEALADAGEMFDVILNMEVIEHVASVSDFISACSKLMAPGGLMVLATINRTAKAYALAIVGAEYILRWLPRGTHDWGKFVTPEELEATLAARGFRVTDRTGVFYNPLKDRWALSHDMDVNYMMVATAGG